MSNFEKKEFIESHLIEVKPLLSEEENTLLSNEELSPDVLLEKYKTKLFYHEKKEANDMAESVLFSVNDPGAYNAVESLIRSLEEDSRCKGVGAIASGLARKNLEVQFQGHLKEVSEEKDFLLEDIADFSQAKKIDILVGTVSALNGPEGVVLYGGKSNFQAKKVFLIAEGWGTLGSQFSSGNSIRMDEIDAILCADEFSKKIFQRQLPELPKNLFEVVGSPVIDNLHVENPRNYTRESRQKLSLDENTIAFLYLGDVSSDFEKEGFDPEINEKTSIQTFHGLIELATTNPEQYYALLFRSHPRDPNKEVLLDKIADMEFPKNLQVVLADADTISIQEARYASDVVMSIVSTEIFFASYMGRPAIFLGYQGNLGDRVLDQFYGQELLEEMSAKNPRIQVASSGDQLAGLLKNTKRAPHDLEDFPDSYRSESSVDNIKNRIFSS